MRLVHISRSFHGRCCGILTVLLAAGMFAQAQQPTDRFATVNGLRLHYLDWGGDEGKQPFLMLHGISRVAHTFDHIAPAFLDRFRVIAIDMRGHGDSDWSPEGNYLVEDYASDLEAFIDQLNLRDVVLLGNSTGGRVVQVYAGMHPERVAKLIVEDVGPERPTSIASGFAQRVAEEEKGWASEEELLASLNTPGNISDELQRTYVRYGSKRREDARVVWKRDPNLTRGFVETDLWRFVSKITAPTIYILGGASNIVPPMTQFQIQQTLPNVKVVAMRGLGHYPSQEAPEAFLELVRAFLE